MRRGAGVALLEAIVALAILAAAGLALFAALTQTMQMVNRADRARKEAATVHNLLAVAELVNPMERPSGSMQLGDRIVSWRSRLREPVQDGATGYLSPGYYEVGLYELELRIEGGEEPGQSLTVRKAGWKQVRQPAVIQ